MSHFAVQKDVKCTFMRQKQVTDLWEEESPETSLAIDPQNGIRLTSPSLIEVFNYGITLVNRFSLKFKCQAPRTKILASFPPDIIVFGCAKREDFWAFCSEQIERIYSFMLEVSPQSGYKYLVDSNLLFIIQVTTINLYTQKEVSRLPLTYLRYIKTSQYTWLTMIHFACGNGLDHCDSTTLKPFVFQALTFLRHYFFPNVEVMRDALAPSLEPVIIFLYRVAELGILDSVMLDEHSIDLLKKCLSLDNYETETIFRILVAMEILSIMAEKNALFLDASGVTDRILHLLEVLMEILKDGERSIYWIATIDSIFTMACHYLKIALSTGLMKHTLSRIAKIMCDYLDITFSEKLFFKRPLFSVISLYADSLLADDGLDLNMVLNEVGGIEVKLAEYNSYFCQI
ncbi:hypothetical protein GE061_007116 [Apolygus lucorum]|uniref:Uncharacterized protein n=1 Tax=Apolygus lucorum TaxID=248454 RepID=A0A6A4IRJ3_APOLU|nr:hypothetical protein GE061_007116 [Apolygus lucorum]